MTTTHIGELDFLRKLQRLLSEGDFSATLKFALLNSLADLSIEHPAATAGSLRIPLNSIAAHFIEYYWRQALPYRAPGGNASVLLQNAGKQIVAINAVDRLRSHNPTLAGARRTQRYESELNTVAANIELMPLWKLQRIGNDVDEFLYRRAEFADGSIRLLPGVPAAFKSLHGLVVDVVRGAWVRRIGRISRPLSLLRSRGPRRLGGGSLHRLVAVSGGSRPQPRPRTCELQCPQARLPRLPRARRALGLKPPRAGASADVALRRRAAPARHRAHARRGVVGV